MTEKLVRIIDERGRIIKFVNLNTLSEYKETLYHKPESNEVLLINKKDLDINPLISTKLNPAPSEFPEIIFRLRENPKENLIYKFDALDIAEIIKCLKANATLRQISIRIGYTEEAIEHLIDILEHKKIISRKKLSNHSTNNGKEKILWKKMTSNLKIIPMKK